MNPCNGHRDNIIDEDKLTHCTEVRFASFLSSGSISAIVVNPPESKLTKRTSVPKKFYLHLVA